MNLCKKLFLGFFVIIGFSVFAADEKEEILKQAKTHFDENVEKRIGVLQKAKICGAKATTRDELKNCRKQLFESMEPIRDDEKKQRASFKDARIERRNALKKEKLELNVNKPNISGGSTDTSITP